MPRVSAHARYELMFKDKAGLRDAIGALRRRYGAHAALKVNLPNKDKSDDILSWIDAVRALEGGDDIDIVPHYSMKNNYHRDVNAVLTKLETFARTCTTRGTKRCLLVTGSGDRKLDSVEALRRLGMDRAFKRDVVQDGGFKFECAFNPYFPEKSELDREFERLEKKLNSGLVGGLWLQIGSDCDALDAALVRIKNMSVKNADAPLRLHGSVFMPSKQLLAQMKFRPWRGVFLSEEWLESVENAERVTMKQLEIFTRHGVHPLIESGLVTDAQFDQCEQLLVAYHKHNKRARAEDEDDANTTYTT